MARLSTIKPRLSALKGKLKAAGSTRILRDRERDQRPWRGWYKTSRWQKLRMKILRRDLFTCQWSGCGRVVADTSKLVADHREPHRGDEVLFWDENNLWTLCKQCHDSAKQREERRGYA